MDAVPHPKCADEPLFAMIPIPYELVCAFAIGRNQSETGKPETTEREVELASSSAGADKSSSDVCQMSGTIVDAAIEWTKHEEEERAKDEMENEAEKKDVFAEKILYSDIQAQKPFQDYAGPPREFNSGVLYFIQKFKECLINDDFNDSFIHVTCATDTNNSKFLGLVFV